VPFLYLLAANQTTCVDVTLLGRMEKTTFRFDSVSEPRYSFKGLAPAAELS
jgi:hypothetical protein